MSSILRSFELFLHSYFPFKSILFVPFVFGIYYPFSCSKPLTVLAKLYCLFVSLAVPVLPLLFSSDFAYSLCHFLYFSIAVWDSLLVGGKCFKDYCDAVELTDRALEVTQAMESYRSYMFFFGIAFIRAVFNICNIPIFDSELVIAFYLIVLYTRTSVDFSHLNRIFIFDIFYERMKLLGESFESMFVDSTDNEDELVFKVKHHMLVYKQRLDDFQLVNNRVQATYLAALVLGFCSSISSIQLALTFDNDIKQAGGLVFNALLEVVFNYLLVCIPVLYTELASHEAENIRCILTKQLHKCSGERLRTAISVGLCYLRLRPFRFVVWRAVPVDCSLLASYCGLMFTYVFILFQLYHFV